MPTTLGVLLGDEVCFAALGTYAEIDRETLDLFAGGSVFVGNVIMDALPP